MSLIFPPLFAELDYLVDWALPTENGRNAKRAATSPEALRSFYDAVLPHLTAALDHLDTFPFGELPEAEQRLLFLTLSMAHVGLFIEVYRGTNYVPHAFEESRFINDTGDERPIFKLPNAA